ncbi:MAG TPA: cupredoxin domain-containing protein [Candidatus Limnocylindrales bacterium]|jgi:plastocyanin
MRHWKLIVGGVVVVVLVLGAAAALALSNTLGEAAAGDVSSGPATGDAQHLTMKDNAFEPTSIEVAAGTPVQIELRNDGQANHNFTSEALHVSTGPMKTGDVKTVTITVPKGTTQFICTWHQGMVVDVVGR